VSLSALARLRGKVSKDMKALTDYQRSILLAAAQPLTPEQRRAFMTAVTERLVGIAEVGEGTVARVCREIQKQFFDPANLAKLQVAEQRLLRADVNPSKKKRHRHF
jgi:hypothetical protein